MHRFDENAAQIMLSVLSHALERLRLNPVPLDLPQSIEYFEKNAPSLICEQGTPYEQVLAQYKHVLETSVLSIDSPRFLSFIPAAPTKASLLFDLVVSSGSLAGISWLESSGLIWAENQTLRWIADLAGMPKTASGCFVSGATMGTLSALVVAREQHRKNNKQELDGRSLRPALLCSDQTHSCSKSAAMVMDCDVIAIPTERENHNRLTASAVERYLSQNPMDAQRIFALVATSGTTNLGIIDDIASLAPLAQKYQWWMHVDGAYGGAGLLSPMVRDLYQGIELADSFVVDPHKWLFAPFDCAALIYKNPQLAKAVHTQKASYLDILQDKDDDYNPSDYAFHLTRRARGLPLWFSLSVYGVAAYRQAIEKALHLARYAAKKIQNHPNLQLWQEPMLSVVVFQRHHWRAEDYQKWSDQLLADQVGFVVPTSVENQPALRFAFLNPETNEAVVDEILARF